MAKFIKWNDETLYEGFTPVELISPLTKKDFRYKTRQLHGVCAMVRYAREFIPESVVGRVHISRWATFKGKNGEWERWAVVERRVAYFSDPMAAVLFRIMI